MIGCLCCLSTGSSAFGCSIGWLVDWVLSALLRLTLFCTVMKINSIFQIVFFNSKCEKNTQSWRYLHEDAEFTDSSDDDSTPPITTKRAVETEQKVKTTKGTAAGVKSEPVEAMDRTGASARAPHVRNALWKTATCGLEFVVASNFRGYSRLLLRVSSLDYFFF